MRRQAFRIAEKLAEISKRAAAIAALISELAEHGEEWELDAIVEVLGGY